MGFSDISFILLFILIFIPLYYLLPSKIRRYLLLLGSLGFYALNDIYVLPVLVVNFFIAFFIGIGIEKFKEKKHISKALTISGIALQIALMVSSILLARYMEHAFIGVGFFTIQIIGYYMEVQNAQFAPCKNPLDFLNYMLFFPKVLQGPIVSYKNLSEDLSSPKKFNAERLEKGIRIFILGMSMKVLLADRLYFLWNDVQTIGFLSISSSLAWLTMYSYSIQLYLDFQGYSLMAIGIAMILGYDLPSNFKSPYLSGSISEFYRRWHITLGQWFRDHVYFPLGGSRNGKRKMFFALFMVWLLTGLWHGLTVNFLIWAGVLFFFILMEKTICKKIFNSNKLALKILSHLYVLFIIPMTWMIFAIPDVDRIMMFFSRLFNITTYYIPDHVQENDVIKYINNYLPYLIGGTICCLPVMENILVKTRVIITRILCFILFWLCIYTIMKNGNNPFMYINF